MSGPAFCDFLTLDSHGAGTLVLSLRERDYSALLRTTAHPRPTCTSRWHSGGLDIGAKRV